MSIGLICEFNPFHNGHKYIIDKAHSYGEPVICVMSGPFVQRGEPACASKYDRTRAALSMGAEAVIELPVKFVLSAARSFAKGGIETLKSIKGVNALIFGIECSADLLFEIAELKRQPKTDELIKSELDNGVSYPTAVKNALTSINPKYGEALRPNTILALEYLDALVGTGIKPLPVQRVGGGYNELDLTGEKYASASAIRNAYLCGNDCDRFLPHIMRDKIRAYDKKMLEKMIQYAILTRSVNQLKKLPEVEAGFEYSLYEAARLPTLSGTIEKLKSKRYTYARIRRILLSTLLGLDTEMPAGIKTRVLGIKRDFAHNLSDFGENIVTRNSLAPQDFFDDTSVKVDCLAQDVYALITGGKLNEYHSVPMIID